MDRQPHGAVEIDDSNPLAAGIINAVTGSLGAPVIGSRLVTRSGSAIVQTVTTKGHIFGGFDGGTAYVVVDSNARIVSGTLTCICIIVANNANGFVYYASEGGSGAGKGWAFGQSATTSANKIGMSWGGVADYSLSTGTLTTGVPTVVGVVVSRSGGTARYFIDGQFDSSRAVGTFGGAGTAPLTLSGAHNGAGYGNYLPAGYGVGFCAVWDRALSDEEVAQVSANPWQLFRETLGSVFVPAAAPSSIAVISSGYHQRMMR